MPSYVRTLWARCAMALTLAVLACAPAVAAQPVAPPAQWDEAAPAGANYETAAFRLWLPPIQGAVRAVLILTPGSNGDGRGAVDDPAWQAFASRERLALVGVQLTDKPPRGFAEQYIDVRRGSGDAVLAAITNLGRRAGHGELATAPLLLWGMSAGGEFNYEFAAWKPERVAAFVVNKGGVYHSGFLNDAARRTPGLFFTGELDRSSRKTIIQGLFQMNRRAGALWAFVEEKGLAHVEGRSPELARTFFAEVLAQRLPSPGSPLLLLSPEAGIIGDPKTGEVRAAKAGEAADETSAWLPGAKTAQAWSDVVKASGPPAK